ncbi:MAG: hypothetical protein ACOY90_15225 [Candidatus Zhuqueibacterota bacterium]
MINYLFDTLEDWRHLPNYQLERRADIFFAIHLKTILKHTHNIDVKAIIPEFPIRIGSIYPDKHNNKSYKVDYAVFDSSKCYLIELKTDDGSAKESQFINYFEAIEIGFESIVKGILDIVEATEDKYKSKYLYLIEKLTNINAINNGRVSSIYSFHEKPICIKPTGEDVDKIIVINFMRISRILNQENDGLTIAFRNALDKWVKPA